MLAYAFEYNGIAVMDESYGRDITSTESVTTRTPPTSSCP